MKKIKSKQGNNKKIGTKHHDSLFASAMSDLRIAKDFFEQHLPRPLFLALNLKTLETCKDKFINDNLKSKVTDMLYRVQFNDGRDSYLRVLIEHQSKATLDIPLRVLEYECSIMRQSYLNTGKFPLVYTVVYYNGEVRWPYPTDLKELIDAPAELCADYALKPFQLVDLTLIDDETLRQHLWSGVMGLVMKHIYERDVLPTLEKILTALQEMEGLKGRDFIKAVLYYIYTQGEVSDKNKFKSLIQYNLSQDTRAEFMTLAEQEVQERIQHKAQELLQEGQDKGKLFVAKNLLAKGLDLVFISETTGIDINILKQMKDSGRRN